MAHPYYHLRPCKYIDRYLFMHVLFRLHKLKDIEKYKYIGFGSYFFDEFKLLHNHLGMSKLVSLEVDHDLYIRAEYNKPFKCIDVLNKSSGAFISDFSKEDNLIFWLDYTNPKEIRAQFSEFCNLIDKMEPGDVVRITLNANPAAMEGGKGEAEEQQARRLEKLRERLGEFVPLSASADDMIHKNYPTLLLSCLEEAVRTAIHPSQFNPKILLPLFSTVYADGQQMVTLTAIMADGLSGEVDKIKELLPFSYTNFKWNEPCLIKVPPLTPKEIIGINNLLPHTEPSSGCLYETCKPETCELSSSCSFLAIKKDFSFAFKDGDGELDTIIKSYIACYNYYPSFHHISF